MKLPNMKAPCKDCPFRKDSPKGWLGGERMKGILNQGAFTCHKTDKDKQCAGHMIIKGMSNDFVRLADKMRIDLKLSGGELVFDSESDCIEHHDN